MGTNGTYFDARICTSSRLQLWIIDDGEITNEAGYDFGSVISRNKHICYQQIAPPGLVREYSRWQTRF